MEKMSLKAYGLLHYMHIRGEEFSFADALDMFSDGRGSTTRAVNELIERGLIERVQPRKNGKMLPVEWHIKGNLVMKGDN